MIFNALLLTLLIHSSLQLEHFKNVIYYLVLHVDNKKTKNASVKLLLNSNKQLIWNFFNIYVHTF